MLPFTFFKNKSIPFLKVTLNHKLHYAFLNEDTQAIKNELKGMTLSALMQENSKGKKAWQLEYVSEAHLLLIIEKWIELREREQPFKMIKKRPNMLSSQEVLIITRALGQGKLKDLEAYTHILKRKKYPLETIDLLDTLSFNFDAFALLLIAIEDEFGGIDNSALTLNSGLGFLMTCLMLFSQLLTLYRIYNENTLLETKHVIALFFTSISILLGAASFFSDASILMILGLSISIIQSIVELSVEGHKYKCSLLNTDRRMSHLQHCVELSANLLHNFFSLLLVSIILSSCACSTLSMIALVCSTTGVFIWNRIPSDVKKDFKSHIGLSKKSYEDDFNVSFTA